MRVLGIDPGSRITGFGVVEARRRELRHIASGSLRVPDNQDMGNRLQYIYEEVRNVIGETQPDTMAIEKVFVARNAGSALVLGQARGVAMVAGSGAGLPVIEYSALQIKQAVVGRGKAAKEQVQHMVQVLLGLTEMPKPDAADALACAICHINHAESRARINTGVAVFSS